MNPVITVEGLGKRYTLQHQARSGLLRDQLAAFLRNPFRRAKAADATAEEFWALRDVSFSVNQGDVLGIIGRNGAGKSTLLKILSRITEPTTGRVTLRGRVASLLEVGTGFHGELSGRENIFLNGAILGMARAEIRRKFDEIIAFAEVEQFLDTPVKHYSSGMYVRLAFAVAAHLEPEILIVDEVLAVGDTAFQKKCLGKMHEIAAGQGRTVLFVSHNLNAIRDLTEKCAYLEHGCLAGYGPTPKIIDAYARATTDQSNPNKGKQASILEVRMVDEQGFQISSHPGGARLFLEVVVQCSGHPASSLECYLTDLEGIKLGLYSPGHFTGWRLPTAAGTWTLRLPMVIPPLASGNYGFDVCTTLHGHGPDHYIPAAVVFESSSLANHPASWELRKDYSSGYFVLDAGDPSLLSGNSPR